MAPLVRVSMAILRLSLILMSGLIMFYAATWAVSYWNEALSEKARKEWLGLP